MKYMLTWSVKPENQQESIARFKETQAQPPAGIQLINHYWNVNHLGGWAIFTADNHALIAKWLKDWTDLNINSVIPIIDDDELLKIIE